MTVHVGRRHFMSLLGGAAVWPVPAFAQRAGRMPTIGFLGAGTPTTWSPWVAAFAQRLRELGWVEGRTIVIEYRWAEGRSERFAEIAAEFVRLKVDLIAAGGTAVPAVKQATSAIPIVFTLAPDPVRDGLVASLARPGGNVTGLSTQQTDLAGKRLELLREILPGIRRVGIIANGDNSQAVFDMDDVRNSARKLAFDTATLEIRRSDDIAPAIETLKGRAEGLYVVSDPFMNSNQAHINALALAAQLPTMHGNREYVEAGGLISYAASYPDLFRRAGDYVDKILRGAKPADIPVEQPVKFELVINLRTAKALGLEIPPMVLARADEVI
jgi:putative ABC transport system substrate-binding protein